MGLEGDITNTISGQMLQLQCHIADGGVAGRKGSRHLAAHHVADQLGAVGVLGIQGGDVFTVTEDGDAVGQLKHLVQTVGDKDDGNALFSQLPHDAEQNVHFCQRQGSRGFVKDQHAAVLGHGFCDLHDLHTTGSQVTHQRIGIDIDTKVVENILCDPAHLFGVDQFAVALTVTDILRCAEHVDQVELLINTLDTQASGKGGVHSRILRLVHRNGAAVGSIGAGDGFDEGGFSRSVLADQSVNLSGVEVDGNLIQCHNTRKNLLDILQGKDRLFVFQERFLLSLEFSNGENRGDKTHSRMPPRFIT